MNISVIETTGKAMRLTAKETQAKGHKVTEIVRDKTTLIHPKFTAI